MKCGESRLGHGQGYLPADPALPCLLPISLFPVLTEGIQFTKAAVGISLPNKRNHLGLCAAGKSFSREIWVLLKVQVPGLSLVMNSGVGSTLLQCQSRLGLQVTGWVEGGGLGRER